MLAGIKSNIAALRFLSNSLRLPVALFAPALLMGNRQEYANLGQLIEVLKNNINLHVWMGGVYLYRKMNLSRCLVL